MLLAPFGPGCYELRHSNGQLVLFGMAGNVAFRMTSLLPPPSGKGTRRNMTKRSYVLANIATIEYRTVACTSQAEAWAIEVSLKARDLEYVFGEG
jgi:hypothetical protein